MLKVKRTENKAVLYSIEYTVLYRNIQLRPKFIIFLNIYLFLRERQSASWESAEREGNTESEAGSRL